MVSSQEASHKNYSFDERALKRFVRHMIRNHYFVGSFLEKRYVSSIGCYKKVIELSKKDDIFKENVTIVKKRLERFYRSTKWIGITTPDSQRASVKIWVDIDEEIFGIYKFCVRDVLFHNDQVCLKLEVIEPFEEIQTIKDNSINKSISSLFTTSRSTMKEINEHILTWDNFKNSTIFLLLFLLTIITGSGHIIKYLLDYTLRLLEILTPVIIAFFNTLSSMFGYLCFLIAFLLKGDTPKKRFADLNQTRTICYQAAYPYENRYKALPYREKSSVIITELEK